MTESRVQRPTQLEAAYKSVSDNPHETCKQCRFFDSEVKLCGLIENSGNDEITEKGRCNRWETMPGVSVDKSVAPAAIEPVNDPTPEAVIPAAVPTPPSLVDRVKQLFTGKPDESSFQVFKSASGQHYWLARHTNHFEDRDKEILSHKAHESYVARVNLGFTPPPELWTYHTKGTRHGQADQVWLHAGFVFALGHFDDNPEAKHSIKSYQALKGEIELSHGFTYPKWALKDGVYDSYNTFEISTLPLGAASNPFTAFEEIDNMALSDKQAAWIKTTLGEAGLKRVLDAQSVAEKDSDVLKALDAKYKDFVEPIPAESIEAGSGEVIKTLLADMIAVQAAVIEQVDEFKTALAVVQAADATAAKAKDTTLAALTAEVAQLKAQLDARPRSASVAPETEIKQESLPAEVLEANVQMDDFWHAPVKGV